MSESSLPIGACTVDPDTHVWLVLRGRGRTCMRCGSKMWFRWGRWEWDLELNPATRVYHVNDGRQQKR